MSEIIVGTKLRSNTSDVIATVTKINKKYNSAIVDLSDGTNNSILLGTLKNDWTIIEDDEPIKNDEPVTVETAVTNNDIDQELLSKFVKKAQKLIVAARRDTSGYHITTSYNGNTKTFNDKNLQNIRSAIGKIYRGEQ